MNHDDLRKMIDYTKTWKDWLTNVPVKQEERNNKAKFIDQMNQAIRKWEEELANSDANG